MFVTQRLLSAQIHSLDKLKTTSDGAAFWDR